MARPLIRRPESQAQTRHSPKDQEVVLVSSSLMGRVLRPVALLVAGTLLGQATLAVTTSPTAAATAQRWVSSCTGPPIPDSCRSSGRW
jgi:hypothetical protein